MRRSPISCPTPLAGALLGEAASVELERLLPAVGARVAAAVDGALDCVAELVAPARASA